MKSDWKVRHREGEIFNHPRHGFTYTDTESSREISYAGVDFKGDGVTLREHHQFNGSGEGHFGGADTWPAVTLTVALPCERIDLRDNLSTKLKECVDKFIADNEL